MAADPTISTSNDVRRPCGIVSVHRPTAGSAEAPAGAVTSRGQADPKAACSRLAAGPQAVEPAQTGGVETAAVDELLEHQRVLGLFDDLVVGVAEFGRVVGQAGGIQEQAALEDGFELQPDLHLRCHEVEAQPGP